MNMKIEPRNEMTLTNNNYYVSYIFINLNITVMKFRKNVPCRKSNIASVKHGGSIADPVSPCLLRWLHTWLHMYLKTYACASLVYKYTSRCVPIILLKYFACAGDMKMSEFLYCILCTSCTDLSKFYH